MSVPDDVFELILEPDGMLRYIHDDRAAALADGFGSINTHRASDVEPGPGGTWLVNLARVGGPVLGPFPPDARAAALEAEHAWLRDHWLLGQTIS